MPIEAPPDASTTRHSYGPVSVATATPDTTDDPTALGFATTSLQVYRTRTTTTAETDLQTITGTPITVVTPDSTTGACKFLGPVGYTGTLWLRDPNSGERWPVIPSDIDFLTGTAVTWDTLAGRPLVIAAADTQQGARDAIQAVTLSQVTKQQVGLGNVQNLAPVDMPVSTAQAQADQNVQDTVTQGYKNWVATFPAQNLSNFDPAVRAIVTSMLNPTGGGGVSTLPSEPVISTAAASTTGDPATITLTWTSPTSNGGSVITGYKVYRGDTGLVTQTPLSAGTFTYQLSSFTVGVSYDVGVSAINANGEGPIAWRRNLIPTGSVAPPPSNKPGYPSSVTQTIGTDVSGNPTITENWAPPTTDGGSPITGYYVYRSVPGSADYKTGLLGATTRSFLLTNFSFNVSYNVGVSAVNANGEGPVFWTNNIVPTSGTVTPPPTGGTGGTLSTGTGIAALWYFGFQRPWLSELPADVKTTYNHYIIGIGQSGGSGTGNIAWGPGNNGQSVSAFQADVAAIHARGATIVLGIGGSSDGGITITNSTTETQAYNSLKSLIDTYSLDGIDIDLEPSGGSWTVQSVINVCKRLSDNYGGPTKFIIGVTAGLYDVYTAKWLSLAQGLGSYMSYMAPMLYDFWQAGDPNGALNGVTVDKIDIMANGGVPRNKMIMGYMLKPPGGYANASTPTIALNAIQYANGQRPGIRGTFMWESWIEGQNGYTGARSFGAWVRSNIKV